MKQHKRRKNRGFTLVEAVVTCLMMSLVALAITTGTQGAIGAYYSSLFVSEGDILVNNLEIALSDVLRYASYTREEEDTLVPHFNNEEYRILDGCLVLEDGFFYLQANTPTEAEVAKRTLLINRGCYSNLRIKEFELKYNVSTMLYEGSYVLKDQTRDRMERKVEFCFRTLKDAQPKIPN